MFKRSLLVILLSITTVILFACDNIHPYTMDEIEDAIEITYADGDQASYVTQNITLPLTLDIDSNVTISWYSMLPQYISEEGIVNRGSSDQNVVLSATIEYYDEISYVDFVLTVIGLNASHVYKITFDTQGGSDLEDLVAYEGDEVSAPENPTRDGYEFAGWYTTTSFLRQYTFNTMPSGNITVYAKWNYIDNNIYTISFDSMGGSSVAPISNNGGVSISEPTEPTKDGYEFGGWYSDQNLTSEFNFNFMPYESIVLYARWIEPLDITFEGYYQSLDGIAESNLRQAVHTLINTGFHGVDYGEARYRLDDTDADPNHSGNLILIYLGTSVDGSWDSGSTWNREHIWPQSLLGVSASNSVVNEASDLHHLKPSDPQTNSSRGNKWYANTTTSVSYAPRDEVKGDIARMLFYMDVMYDSLTLVNLSAGQEPSVYEMGDLKTLIEWNSLDPVDQFEISRNDVIYGIQGNRNPFVDHPELVDLIWN